MEAIKCELCGSNDFAKEGNFFVCQHCGTKYTTEDAKKLLITVTIDKSEEIKNLYVLARRAKAANDAENAYKYYEMILQEEPYSWEAVFYTAYYSALQDINGNLIEALLVFQKKLAIVVQIISDSDTPQERPAALKEVFERTIDLVSEYANTAGAVYYKSERSKPITTSVSQENIILLMTRLQAVEGTYIFLGDQLKNSSSYSDEIDRLAAEAWKRALDLKLTWSTGYISRLSSEQIAKYSAEVRKYYPKFTMPTKQEGCYIATCVYGSYDSNEVLVLRNYRDNRLMNDKLGRLFVKAYYSTSPSLVKWFGKRKWFISLSKGMLDRIVCRLSTEASRSHASK
ncbi:MAG TPA: TFIIB-type zinc finger domain-containing protein [Candidatus Cryosericum sp.]|nr:TFIIB-type zinc finger domain-containing protein [Candidatus Cryosericum sp.]